MTRFLYRKEDTTKVIFWVVSFSYSTLRVTSVSPMEGIISNEVIIQLLIVLSPCYSHHPSMHAVVKECNDQIHVDNSISSQISELK